MLVLSRKKNESIVINSNIVCTVLGIDNGKALLGFTAPEEVKIYRQEVYDAIHAGEVAPKVAS